MMAGRGTSRFQPTLPARGATLPNQRGHAERTISTHAPRTGSDASTAAVYASDGGFQPTLPARGATYIGAPSSEQQEISTHAPRTGSDVDCRLFFCANPISTHAPRTGSDGVQVRNGHIDAHFNPRSPHGERREQGGGREGNGGYFNPRSPHGERRFGKARRVLGKRISTHAPRTGSDRLRRDAFPSGRYFNPRSPHGERRNDGYTDGDACWISTHAPRTGSDFAFSRLLPKSENFNPRSPHGERRPA